MSRCSLQTNVTREPFPVKVLVNPFEFLSALAESGARRRVVIRASGVRRYWAT